MVDGEVCHHGGETALGPRPVIDLGPSVSRVVVGPEVIVESVAVLPESPTEQERPLVHCVVDHSVPESGGWSGWLLVSFHRYERGAQ